MIDIIEDNTTYAKLESKATCEGSTILSTSSCSSNPEKGILGVGE